MSTYEPICLRCDEEYGRITLATEEHGGEHYCENCLSSMAEAAHERMLADHYGGSSPQSIAEHYDAAATIKRSQR